MTLYRVAFISVCNYLSIPAFQQYTATGDDGANGRLAQPRVDTVSSPGQGIVMLQLHPKAETSAKECRPNQRLLIFHPAVRNGCFSDLAQFLQFKKLHP